MKKTIFIAGTFLLLLAACKTQSAVSDTSASAHTYSAEADMAKAQSRFPEITAAQLKNGHDIYYGACTDCHKTKNISGYTEEKLSKVLDKMAYKAKLSQDQKDDVWKYMITLRLK